MQEPQSHLAQHSAMRRRWAWPRIRRQIAYMCVASTARRSLSLSAGCSRTRGTRKDRAIAHPTRRYHAVQKQKMCLSNELTNFHPVKSLQTFQNYPRNLISVLLDQLLTLQFSFFLFKVVQTKAWSLSLPACVCVCANTMAPAFLSSVIDDSRVSGRHQHHNRLSQQYEGILPGFGNCRQGQEAFYWHYQWETTACQVEENLWLERKLTMPLFGGKQPYYPLSIPLALDERPEGCAGADSPVRGIILPE